MALNKYMHPRNPYKTKKPSFKELAIKYPEFREKVTQNLTGKVILDFKDPEALRALTIALLKNDFGLTVSLPVDRLIPTVPQRLNYILWLEDIFNQKKDLRGIDIGEAHLRNNSCFHLPYEPQCEKTGLRSRVSRLICCSSTMGGLDLFFSRVSFPLICTRL